MSSGWSKWWPISTVWGKDGEHETAYQTRIKLMPRTPWGQLRLHIFWRGDADPDPHDHPSDFWTFPFMDYAEMVLLDGKLVFNGVKSWRWTKREATYIHRVIGPIYYNPANGPHRTLVTLCWFGPKRRSWGFWVKKAKCYAFKPWRQYIFEGRSNRD